MEPFQVIEANNGLELKVICVGIGGAGCNVIEHLYNKALGKIDLIAINTDAESLAKINGIKKIQIGSKLVKGLSTSMKPVGTVKNSVSIR
jgi:cell division protein FtsZ